MGLAMVLTEPRKLISEKRYIQKPSANFVRIKVIWAGICSTDISIYEGDYKVPLPIVLGHEFSGIVEDAGPGVSTEWIGKPVVGEINNTCLATGNPEPCIMCIKGMPHHCINRTTVGIMNHDGAFAEHIMIPHGSLHIIPDGIGFRHATFTEPLAAAFQTFSDFTLSGGDLVVIIGGGKLGLLITAVASYKGARVIAVDPHEKLRELALKFGAFETFHPGESLNEKINRLNNGIGPDIVVEASGKPGGLNTAINLVRPRGIIVQKSTPGLPASNIDITKITVNEIRIQGSRCGQFKEALALLDRHIIPLDDIIRAEYPLSSLPEAMEDAKHGGKLLIKVSGE